MMTTKEPEKGCYTLKKEQINVVKTASENCELEKRRLKVQTGSSCIVKIMLLVNYAFSDSIIQVYLIVYLTG